MSESIVNPYPGLRPFRDGEEFIFFGRERQVDLMVDKLSETRFLAVVGTSGSGKSSLVNCGLRPALHLGLMSKAGSSWRVAVLRPGNSPLHALATALAKEGVLYKKFDAGQFSAADIIGTTLRMSKLGLVDAYRQAKLDSHDNLLVIVDQFEELFRYWNLGATRSDADAAEQATAFINLLLEACAQTECPIYIVLTMRSDFLGDCSQFFGLPEAISSGQYLVPRMVREERRVAIVGPAGVGDAEIAPILVTRLVNDVGDNPDQLSILQHALNRTWCRWQQDANGKVVELAHYEAIGTMSNALDAHAEEAYRELAGERKQRICERIFKALTDRGTDARGIRRPTTLAKLAQLANAKQTEVVEVINVFRTLNRSFLMPPHEEALQADTVVDISHESLMRVWERLKSWVDEEAQSAQMFRRIAETAELNAAGKASLWRDPDLQMALDWRQKNSPNETWAAQYRADFTRAMQFLDASEHSRTKEEAAAAQRRRRNNWIRVSAFVAMAVVAISSNYLYRKAAAAEQEADQQRKNGQSLQVAAQVKGAIGSHPDVALALGVAADLLLPSPESRQAVLESLEQDRRFVGYLWHHTGVEPSEEGDDQRPIAFRADGKLFASATANEIVLWDVSEKKPIGKFERNAGLAMITALAFSRDGKLLAIGDEGGEVSFRDLTTLQPLDVTLRAGNLQIRRIAFAADDKQLISTASYGQISVWNLESHKLIYDRNLSDSESVPVALSEDGRIVAFQADATTIKLWDVSAKTFTGEPLKSDGANVLTLAMSPDRKWLASGNDNGTISLWKLDATAPVRQTLAAHHGSVSSLAFSADNSMLASGSADQSIVFWDLATRKQFGAAARGGYAISSLVFGSDTLLAAATYGDGIAFWNSRAASALDTKFPTNKENDVARVALSSDGRTLYASTLEPGGRLSVVSWDVATRKKIGQAMTSGRGIVLHRHGLVMASFTNDGIVLQEPTSGTEVGVLQIDRNKLSTYAFTPDGRAIVVGTKDGRLLFYDIASKAQSGDAVTTETKSIRSIAFSDDGSRLAIDSDDGMRVWDAARRTPISDWFRPNSEFVAKERDIALSHDGKQLACSLGRELIIWDVATHKTLGTPMRVANGWIGRIAFSPDGKSIVAATELDGVFLWDIAARKAPQQFVRRVENTAEGSRAGTQSARDTNSRTIFDLVFSSDAKLMAAGGPDGSLAVWDIDADSWHRRACALAGRNLSPLEWRDAFGNRPYEKLCPAFAIHPAWLEEAHRLAMRGRTDEARASLTRLAQLEPSMAIDPDAEIAAFAAAQETLNILAMDTKSLVTSDVQLQKALNAYQRAAKNNSALTLVRERIDGNTWNQLCWDGALNGRASMLLFACENAVAGAPTDGGIRDSRGIARSLTGDYAGAIEDFKAFIEWAKSPGNAENEEFRSYIVQRGEWIKTLAQNRNPLTPEMLKSIDGQ